MQSGDYTNNPRPGRREGGSECNRDITTAIANRCAPDQSSQQHRSGRDGHCIQEKSATRSLVAMSLCQFFQTTRLRTLLSTGSWYQSQSVRASRKRESYTRSGVSWLAGRDRTGLIGRWCEILVTAKNAINSASDFGSFFERLSNGCSISLPLKILASTSFLRRKGQLVVQNYVEQ